MVDVNKSSDHTISKVKRLANEFALDFNSDRAKYDVKSDTMV